MVIHSCFANCISKRKKFLIPQSILLTELGKIIRLARNQNALTQRVLAIGSGVGRRIIQLMENGRSGVGLDSYLMVLLELGLENQLLMIVATDTFRQDILTPIR